ncbi:MAG: hypothetical protein JWP91_4166 [Fibrobacteres bacterium]|nr:hypothetical protein [Fibrobacterota bacterium]
MKRNRAIRRSALRILFIAVLGLGLWNCNVSNQDRENLLSIKVDDSLSTYDTIRVDILYPNGTAYKESVFYGKYKPGADHKIKDLDLGGNPPANYQILITGIREGTRVLVVSIKVTPDGSETPKILVREPPLDTSKPPLEILPVRVALNTATPLILSTGSQATKALAAVEPAGADQTLLWSTSDSGVVRVDAAGSLYPGIVGETDITIRSKRDPGLSAVLHVKVIQLAQVKGVTVTPDRLTLYMGGASFKLTAQATPPESQVSVIFLSGNDSVAKVDPDGTVRAVRIGSTAIKVYPAGYPSLALECLVTVEIDVPVLDAGGDRNVRPKETVAFPLKVTQKYGDIAVLKWDLDGDGKWDDSTNVPTASPQHVYSGEDSVVTVRFHVRDTEGNVDSLSRKVHIGQTLAAPAFTDKTTPSPTSLAKPTWAWTGNPGAGGSGTYRYSLDGRPPVETKATTFTADSLADGDHSFVLRELDGGGIPSDSAVRVIRVVTKGPIVTITTPQEGALTNAAAIGVTWIVKPLTGANVANSNSENLTGKQGAVKIIREATDTFGNKGADTVVVFRDTIAPPSPAFTGLSSPASVNASYTSPVQWAWTRATPNDSFLVSLNGAVATRQGGTTFVLSNPLNQTYILNVMAVDSAGNTSPATTYSILVDRTAPPAPVVSGTTPTGTPAWTWGAASGSDGARVYRYKLSTAAGYSVETSSASYSPTGLVTGTYTLQVQERDQAGNWSGDGSFAIEVDRTGPSITVGKPTPFGRVTSANPVVSGTASDDHIMKKVEYRINTGSYSAVPLNGGNWTFSDNYDAGANTVWIRGEDQFGNRDSTSISIYKYPNVVFVRKNATGTGKSWEDAYGELHQALDSAKMYPAGTQIWVTKGSYTGPIGHPNELSIFHSDLAVMGGFYDDRPSTDTTQRNFSTSASTIASVFFMGTTGVALHDFRFDGFTMGDRFWLANADHYRNTFRNLRFNGLSSTTNIILTRGNNTFEKCEFTNLNSTEEPAIFLKGINNFQGCRFENNKSAAPYSPIELGSSYLTVRDCYFSNSIGTDGSFHFYLSHDVQNLDIDGSRIQGGKAAIKVDSAYPMSQFIYGSGNTSF